jgi:hypothetical protein
MHAHESMTEQAAFEVAVECILDETGIAGAVLASVDCSASIVVEALETS